MRNTHVSQLLGEYSYHVSKTLAGAEAMHMLSSLLTKSYKRYSNYKALLLNGINIKERYITVAPSKGGNKKDAEPITSIPAECRTIFVKGLPYKATENDIGDIFKDCGSIKEVRMVNNWKTNEFKGFAYIEFVHSRAVKNAVKLNGTVVDGRSIRIV